MKLHVIFLTISFLFYCPMSKGSYDDDDPVMLKPVLPRQTDEFDEDREKIKTFEGDILGLDRFYRENALQPGTYKWPNATVFYQLSDSFSCEEKCVIYEAMLELEKKTCLNFIRRNHHNDYIDIVKEQLCASYVGRQRNSQKLYLSPVCAMNIGNVMHELIHAVGFFHEHSRMDRNNFITINWDNIDMGDYLHFKNRNLGHVTTYDMFYDYDSLMHYGPYYFSKNGNVTIETKNDTDQTRIGQREKLSEIDIRRINVHYKCNTKHFGCIDKEISCKNSTLDVICKQRVVREKVCPKSCDRCKSKSVVCHLCANHSGRCQKWTDIDHCPEIDVNVRKDYYRDCEIC